MEEPPKFVKNLETKAERLRKNAFAKKPQPMSPFGVPYIGFQNRMLAATLDSLVFFLTIIPLSLLLTNAMFGPIDTSMVSLAAALEGVDDPVQRGIITREFLFAPHKIQYFMVNTLLQLAGIFPYCIWFWKHYGATPGKMFTRQKVVLLSSGEYLNYKQGIIRCLGYLLDAIPPFLGVIWIALDAKRQGWHDKLVGSVVISSKRVKATVH